MKALPTSWSMPIGEYDTTFVEKYLPIPTAAGVALMNGKYREPTNADYWDKEAAGLLPVPEPPEPVAPVERAGPGVLVEGHAPWETQTV
jgi:hypothetical protein